MERLRSECLSCVIKNQIEKFPKGTPEEQKIKYMQEVFSILSHAEMTESAPVIVRKINQLQEEMFQMTNEYGKIKTYFNDVMMGYESDIIQRLEESEDPLKLAIQYSMIGNYIDFGAMKHVDEEYLTNLLNSAKDNPIDEKTYECLKQDLQNGENLVLLTDNCGEVVMDKLLIQTIQKRYPDLKITAIVRGEDVLNDATMEDAVQIGLTNLVEVIGNGNGIAGTCLEELSKEAEEKIEKADVILSKGQGNFETLRKCGRNVYYIFLCKCDMFANLFQVEKFTGMLINDKDC